MSTAVTLSRSEMARLHDMVTLAVRNVSRGMTEMFGASVSVEAAHVRMAPLAEASNIAGNPEAEVVGLYLAGEGRIRAHLLLMLPLATALSLCDVLLEEPPGTTAELGEMEVSALGEVGNIVGSYFLNSLSEQSGLRMDITPPGVLRDMAGAAVNVALFEVAMHTDEAVVIDADFQYQERHLPAWFLAFAEPANLRLMLTGKGA